MPRIDWTSAERESYVDLRFLPGAIMTPGASTTITKVYAGADLTAEHPEFGEPIFFLQGVPVSVFRAGQHEPLVGPCRDALSARTDSWAVVVSISTRNEAFWRATPSIQRPPGTSVSRIGPYSSADLPDLAAILRRAAAIEWAKHQSSHIVSVGFRRAIGMTESDFMDAYRSRSYAKHAATPAERQARGSRILGSCFAKAAAALRRGDAATAAQYSRPIAIRMERSRGIMFGPEPGNAVGKVPFVRDFGGLASEWTRIEGRIRGIRAGLSMVESEGYAEWHSARMTALVASGELEMLMPVDKTPAPPRPPMSPTNPYRRGLELMERLEERFGPHFVLVAGPMITLAFSDLCSWLTEDHLRVLDASSVWAPDRRLECLAELKTAHSFTPGSIGELLQDIVDRLDTPLPGCVTYAEACYRTEEAP